MKFLLKDTEEDLYLYMYSIFNSPTIYMVIRPKVIKSLKTPPAVFVQGAGLRFTELVGVRFMRVKELDETRKTICISLALLEA